jgi:CelD/BcsL family acetyltransferase involved in cellulose biosynthesis
MPAAAASTVETLSFGQFCDCAPEWDELALAVPRPVPFTCHPWLRTWWRHFGTDQEFAALVLRRDGRLDAAAPLALRRAAPGLSVAELVGTGPVPTRGMGLADKADLLVREGRPEAGTELTAALARLLERVDLLDIKGYDAGSATAASLAAAAPAPFAVRRLDRSVSPYLALSDDWETYLAARSRNFRKHLKKYWRLLEAAGTVEVTRMEQGADVARWMDDVFEVNESSWKSERGTNLFRSPAIRRFFAELVPEMATHGWIDLHLARVDGRPAVYELGFDYGGRLFSYNGAYRAELRGGSPGTALTAAVIESACRRGLTEYDMLRGAEPYKLRWSETTRTERRSLVPAARLGARFKTLAGPYIKARLKQWRWLDEQVDRLAGALARIRYRP